MNKVISEKESIIEEPIEHTSFVALILTLLSAARTSIALEWPFSAA